jgi:hypothetical protein
MGETITAHKALIVYRLRGSILAFAINLRKRRRLQLSSAIVRPQGNLGQRVMLDLQREQFEHDERFHRDILRLDIHARLNHMALHFCKYTGQFATVFASGDAELRSRTITDSFIISLCSANALDLNLSEKVAPSLGDTVTLHDIGIFLASRLYPGARLDDAWLLAVHAIHAGKIARACEKIDHLEAFPFREELRESAVRLCQIALIGASTHSVDLLSAARERRRDIRLRSPFFAHLYQEKN